MTIWVVALVLFVCVGYVGLQTGAIRAAFSFAGLIVGAFLAMPLGHLPYPLLRLIDINSPWVLPFLGPFVVFLVFQVAFKVAGQFVYSKVEVYYKYKASELQQGLFARVHHRVGLCIGLANAAVYLVLFCFVIYIFSYPTLKLEGSPDAALYIRVLNQLGRDVRSSGFDKIAAAMDPMPAPYYQITDLVSLIQHNPAVDAFIVRYPGFYDLEERGEIQAIGTDQKLPDMLKKEAPITDIMGAPSIKNILDNETLTQEILGIIESDRSDFENYLHTGRSEKFNGEKIIGHWSFNADLAAAVLKKAVPNISVNDVQQMRMTMAQQTMLKATLFATPEKKLYLNQVGFLKITQSMTGKSSSTIEFQDFTGQWKSEGAASYQLSVATKESDSIHAEVWGDHLVITGLTMMGKPLPMAFDRDY